MDLEKMTGAVRDNAAVKRVFGDPYEVDGVIMVPVARAAGGAGGGEDAGSGNSGGGFGFATLPAGAYVIKDGDVRFVPVVDVSGLATRAAVVLVAGLFAWRTVAKAKQRRKARRR